MLNSSAGIEADLTITTLNKTAKGGVNAADETSYYVVSPGFSAFHVKSSIVRSLQDKGIQDVRLTDLTKQFSVLSLQGPQSRSILQRLTEDDLDNEAFPFSCHRVIKVAGITVKLPTMHHLNYVI